MSELACYRYSFSPNFWTPQDDIKSSNFSTRPEIHEIDQYIDPDHPKGPFWTSLDPPHPPVQGVLNYTSTNPEILKQTVPPYPPPSRGSIRVDSLLVCLLIRGICVTPFLDFDFRIPCFSLFQIWSRFRDPFWNHVRSISRLDLIFLKKSFFL